MPAPTRTPTPARRRRSAAVLALAAATAALASGCGGASSPGSAASRASVSAVPTTVPTTQPTTPAVPPAVPPATTAAATPATTPAATRLAASRPATPTGPTTPAAARATTPGPVRIAACVSGALRATVGGPSDAAAGSSSFYLYLTNTGRTACTLSGHPGLSYVAGADGQQVGRPATREGTPQPVALAPGGTAHARIRATNPGDYDEAQCQPVPVTGYRVYPPGQTAALFVREAGTACSAGSASLLVVGPVVAGRPAQPGDV